MRKRFDLNHKATRRLLGPGATPRPNRQPAISYERLAAAVDACLNGQTWGIYRLRRLKGKSKILIWMDNCVTLQPQHRQLTGLRNRGVWCRERRPPQQTEGRLLERRASASSPTQMIVISR